MYLCYTFQNFPDDGWQRTLKIQVQCIGVNFNMTEYTLGLAKERVFNFGV